MEEELRKVRSDLTLSGIGLMLFGAWKFLKIILYCLFAGDYVDRLMEVEELEPQWRIFVEVVWLSACLPLALPRFRGSISWCICCWGYCAWYRSIPSGLW